LTDVVLDKTGTLTMNRVCVTSVKVIDPGMDEQGLLELAVSVEQYSQHPLGVAVADYARGKKVEPLPVVDFRSITAGGVRGQVKGRSVRIGRMQSLLDEGVRPLDESRHAEAESDDARTLVWVAVDGKLMGRIGFDERLKPEAELVVRKLREMKLHVVMMTGDSRLAGEMAGKRLGISEVWSEVKPEDKQGKVKSLQERGCVVAMVGDGINDAPALATADGRGVGGCAWGGGGAARAAAGGLLWRAGGALRGLVRAITLSRATLRRVYMGLFWAFIYNLVLVPAAALGLLHPMFAAAAMSASSISVISNALWLKKTWKPDEGLGVMASY
jgi:Cu+-exporting ATPase